jgi:hypothetical protein
MFRAMVAHNAQRSHHQAAASVAAATVRDVGQAVVAMGTLAVMAAKVAVVVATQRVVMS